MGPIVSTRAEHALHGASNFNVGSSKNSK